MNNASNHNKQVMITHNIANLEEAKNIILMFIIIIHDHWIYPPMYQIYKNRYFLLYDAIMIIRHFFLCALQCLSSPICQIPFKRTSINI